MKKVLILTYHFPPEGGAGIQRVLKFVKYLPEFGYEPFVLTTTPNAKLSDYSLIEEIEGSHVYRTSNIGDRIPYDLKNIFSNYLQPDKKILWKFTAVRRAIDIVRKNKINLIMSTSPPHSIHFIARKVAKECQLPWVADFRDEWTSDSNPNHSKHFQKNVNLEKEILSSADYVTTITSSARKHFEKLTDKVMLIYNGYDPEDFRNLDGIDTENTFEERKLNILYAGHFTPKSSPIKLFKELEGILASDDAVGNDINLVVVGDQKSNAKRLNDYSLLSKHVKLMDYVPHDFCLRLMQKSDALLLLSTNERGLDILTGKLFEYLYSGKPILAIERYESELDVILEAYGNYYLAHEFEKNSVRNAIYQMHKDWNEGRFPDSANHSSIEKFDRKSLTEELARIFNQLLETEQ
jgi:glycosyltransferase involved in cell wall biosynthesis